MKGPAVRVEELSYTYAGRQQPTLQRISFSLEAGSWTLLTGPTGAGKSTLLRVLAGIIPQDSSGTFEGRVLLDGDDASQLRPAQRARRVGLVLQSPDDQICTTTVTSEVAFGLENLAIPADRIGRMVADSLEHVGLAALEQARTQHLSGGEKQRLTLASILAMRPQLLLLDEPLSQLDPVAAHDLLNRLAALRDSGLRILLVEHRLDEVLPRADRVLVLDGGKLAADVPSHDGEKLKHAFAPLGLRLPEVTRLSLELRIGCTHRAAELADALSAAVNKAGGQLKPDASRSDVPIRPSQSDHDTRKAPLLRVEGLAYQFPEAPEPIWRDVTFDVRAGERIALVGPNGSGKSTLLATLCGMLVPSEGKLITDLLDKRTNAIGLVPQNPDLALFCQTVRSELAFAPQQAGLADELVDRQVADAARAMQLESLLDEPPLALSQGQRLRTAIAATLTMQPTMLLLDEPTTGQDSEQVDRAMSTLDRAVAGTGSPECLIFSTHDLQTVAQHADRVLVLSGGRLAADLTPDALLADDELLDLARLRRPPLLELRHRLHLRGRTVDEIAKELLA